jgi:hypothetical protein
MGKKRVTKGRIIKDKPQEQNQKPQPERRGMSMVTWMLLGIATGILIRLIMGFFTKQ